MYNKCTIYSKLILRDLIYANVGSFESLKSVRFMRNLYTEMREKMKTHQIVVGRSRKSIFYLLSDNSELTER